MYAIFSNPSASPNLLRLYSLPVRLEYALLPVVYTLPFVVITTVCDFPEATSSTSFTLSTNVGTNLLSVVPAPSSPFVFNPHAYNLLSSVIANTWLYPDAIFTIFSSSSTFTGVLLNAVLLLPNW